MNTVILEDEYLEAARELREIAHARWDLDAREAKAKEILAKVLAEGETGVDPDGVPVVEVRPGALRWDEDTARKNLPANLVTALEVTETVTRLDRQRAKDTLAPALYELACKRTKPSVVTK
jgi:hypothetical protein